MKRVPLSRIVLIAVTGALLAGSWASAAEPEKTHPKYIRLQRDAEGDPLALQTAIVRFVPSDPANAGLSVDLVGAVHVGEKAYYEELNKRFEQYDVVLFELVAPPGTRIPKGAKTGGHPVAMLQNGLKNMLDLEHQLQYVDYTRDNMVHADMSPDDMAKSMSDRGESFAGMFFRMLGQGMAQQSVRQRAGKTSDFELLAALFDKNRASTMKRLMAEQFESIEGMMDSLDGPDGSTLISERNKVALKKLVDEIGAGKKKIAIFYGAGHMGDMENRLTQDFHLRRANDEWLTAWKLTKAPQAPKQQPK